MANFNRNKSNKEVKKQNIFDSLMVLESDTTFSVDSVRETEYGVFFNLVLFDAVVIFGCRVVDGKNGAFISLPSRKAGDRYYNHVGVKLSDELTQVILDTVEGMLS